MTTTTPPLEKPFGWRFTFPLMLGSTLNPINSSLLATGLAGIAADFHADPGTAASLVSVLYLCSAVMQPTMGKLAMLFGPRRVFLVGVAILLVGGAVGGVAPSFDVLLVSRALIGVGTSACYPTAMAIIRRRADSRRVRGAEPGAGQPHDRRPGRHRVGLPIGGVLAGAFGWRALFFVNVPVALVALAFAALGVERGPGDAARRTVGGGDGDRPARHRALRCRHGGPARLPRRPGHAGLVAARARRRTRRRR